MKWFWRVVDLLSLPFTILFWPINRVFARRCPNCDSKWHTELIGEWQGEDWHCLACGHWWAVDD